MHSKNSGFRINPFVSVTAATIFGIANLYPVAAKWVPPNVATILSIPWYTTGVVGWSILGCGALWWFFFIAILPHIGRHRKGCYLMITRKLFFNDENGYKVLEYEDAEFKWLLQERDGPGRTLRQRIINALPGEVNQRITEDRVYGRNRLYRTVERNADW